MEREDLMSKAREVGLVLQHELMMLKSKHTHIGEQGDEVRGFPSNMKVFVDSYIGNASLDTRLHYLIIQ